MPLGARWAHNRPGVRPSAQSGLTFIRLSSGQGSPADIVGPATQSISYLGDLQYIDARAPEWADALEQLATTIAESCWQ